MLNFIRDIFFRPREKSLSHEDNDSYRLLVEEIQDCAIYMLDQKGNIITWNKGAERIKGYAADEVIGKHYSIFFPPECKDRSEQDLQIASQSGRHEEEGWRVRKDGSRFWASMILTALYKEGSFIGFSKITRDLTQRRRLSILEDMERQRNEFLAMLAHELRNPLAPVRTAVHVIREKYAHRLDDAYLEMDAMLNRQLSHMTRLIDGLLDIARITHGKIVLNKEPVRIIKAIEGAMSVLSSQGKLSRHDISIDCPQELIALADPTRLEQIITNLLCNSVKYTKEGGEIGVVVSSKDDQIHITIRDCGRGIHPDALPHVFDLFYQCDQSIERANGGLGLGLAIVKKLMDLHEGKVEIDSTLGAGTTFNLSFPTMNLQATSSNKGDYAKNKRILIVEDNQDAAHSLSFLFKLDNHEVRICHDGNSAVVMANTFDPDIVILDIGLPGLSGFEVARALRQSTITEEVKIVAVSGYSRDDFIQEAKLAGINEYLPKPADPEKLRKIILDSA